MSNQVKNAAVIALAVIAIAAWGLVARQEIQRGAPSPSQAPVPSPPQDLPAGTRITLPAPQDTRPTEEAPALEIFGTITDAKTGELVAADVDIGNVHLDDVPEFRVVIPLSRSPGDATEITITVTAPGYHDWSITMRPHIQRSKIITAPIKLKPKPAGDQAGLCTGPVEYRI